MTRAKNNLVLVDKKTHLNTKVQTGRGVQFGESIHLIPVVADELRNLIIEYPVCLIKSNETGQFGLHAMAGFEPNENLFLQDDQWSANYVPLHLARQPFMVGIADQSLAATPENTVLTIDMNNKRVNTQQGEALFTAEGEPTDYLRNMNKLLGQLIPAVDRTEQFIAELIEHDLIEALKVSITLSKGEQKTFEGIYNINETNLTNLPAETLLAFQQKGYLQACHLILASMGNLQKLINLKNKQ